MKKNYGFIIELFVMLIGFALVIMVMSGLYARSLADSLKAKNLNDAVILASNGAEVFLAEKDEKGFAEVFGMKDDAEDGTVTVCFNEGLLADENGSYRMVLTYDRQGDLVYGHFDIYFDDELIYDLDTAYYAKEDRR